MMTFSFSPSKPVFDPPVVVKRPDPEVSREGFEQALIDLSNLGLIRVVRQDADWAMVQRRHPRS